MITEDYVSFEVAKLLKEKGFDGRENHVHQGYFNENLIDYTLFGFCDGEILLAPTHQMALKWLREVHNIDIDIDAHVGMLGIKAYVAYVSTYKPYQLTDTDKEFGITKEEVYGRLIQNKRNTRIPDKGELIPAHEYFDSYEQAVEAALKYTLENLI